MIKTVFSELPQITWDIFLDLFGSFSTRVRSSSASSEAASPIPIALDEKLIQKSMRNLYGPVFLRSLKTAILSLVLLFSACHSHRNATTPSEEASDINTSAQTVLSKNEVARSFAATYKACNNWQRLRLPLSLRVMAPKSFSISGTATMIHDESIFISFRMLGFEVAQIFIDNDRIVAIDKYHKKYFSEPLTELLKDYDFNVSNLQAILIGLPFVAGQTGSTVTIPEFEFIPSETTGRNNSGPVWTATSVMKRGGQYGFVFNPSGDILGFAAELSRKTLTVEYSQPFVKDGGRFSGNAYLDITLNSETHPHALALFEWNFGKARWNNDVEPKEVWISEGYDRVTLGELMKILVNK